MAGLCQKWKPVFVMLSVYFVMAIMNILFKKVLDEGVNKLVIITYRLIVGAIFLSPMAYFTERNNSFKLNATIICQLFLSALMGAALPQYLFFLGLRYTSAAFACAFSNMTPVITFVLALPLRQESVNLRSKSGITKALGSLICVGGVILLTLYRGFPLNKVAHTGISTTYHALDMRKWVFGSMFLLLSVSFWAGWFLIQARIGKIYPCKYTSTALMSWFGALQSATLCFAINRDITAWILRGKLLIFTVLFAGIFGSGLSYVAMSWCVERKGAVFTSAFIPSMQIFVMILDFAFFHEQIYFGSVIGSITVICGLYILLWGKSIEAKSKITSKAPQISSADGHCINGSSTTANTTTADVTQPTSTASDHC